MKRIPGLSPVCPWVPTPSDLELPPLSPGGVSSHVIWDISLDSSQRTQKVHTRGTAGASAHTDRAQAHPHEVTPRTGKEARLPALELDFRARARGPVSLSPSHSPPGPHPPRPSGTDSKSGTAARGRPTPLTPAAAAHPRHPRPGSPPFGHGWSREWVPGLVSRTTPGVGGASGRLGDSAPLSRGDLDLTASTPPPPAPGSLPLPWVQRGELAQATEPVAMQPPTRAGGCSTAPPGSQARGASVRDSGRALLPTWSNATQGSRCNLLQEPKGCGPHPHPHAVPICDCFPSRTNNQQPQKFRARMAPYLFLSSPPALPHLRPRLYQDLPMG